MRRFELHLDEDEEVKDAGAVAEGVAFWNGKCCLCWKTEWSGMGQYDSIAHMLNNHGHSKAIRLVWIDSPEKVIVGGGDTTP